jgi:hypothetical protein
MKIPSEFSGAAPAAKRHGTLMKKIRRFII